MEQQGQERGGSTLDVMLARDAVMNTRQILSDLVKSACEDGVKILIGHELLRDSVSVSGVTGKVAGMRVRNREDGRLLHVIADQYVFALGFGFEEGDFLRKRLLV